MFAKSTNHGATWSVKKIRGDFPDYDVRTQTCITNAEGTLYLAYRWGADYGSICTICVDYSNDFGNSWASVADIDGLPNDCSFPSVAATHGGSTVVIAFQYAFSASDIDVCCSYSTNKGISWYKGYWLFGSGLEDEKSPVLAVDGGGMTENNIRGYLYAACKFGSYIKYRKAYYSNPCTWSDPTFVSERWVGKGLAITTQYRTAQFYPCIAWSDERTNNIYYSTINEARVLVSDCYRGLLFREPDPEGFEFWVGELESGTLTRAGLIEATLESVEYRQKWVNMIFVALMYDGIFERVPDQGGYDFYAATLDSGALTWEQMLDLWLSSSEWYMRFGDLNNTAFVTKLYRGMLHREPDSEGLNYWVSMLGNGGLTRLQPILIFYHCPEYQTANVERKMVYQLYLGLLRRVPDAEGCQNLVEALHSGASRQDVINAFLTCAEYKEKHV
jgi:hypothetical protein